MDRTQHSLTAFEAEAPIDAFVPIERHDTTPIDAGGASPAVGQLLGFNLLEQPLVGGLLAFAGQVLTARTTTPLRRAMVGSQVVVVFDEGQPQSPIIVGVVEPNPQHDAVAAVAGVSIHADGERYLIDAEREIVLRCGDASITLTRAGKVIIKGNYILSRSTGCNKIKGAAVDIN